MLWLISLCLVIYVIYVKFVKPGFYWQYKGVFHVKPWGRFVKVFLSRHSFFESVISAYYEFPKRRYYGSYQFLQPSLFVRDLDLIKRITVKDFDYFPDHMSLVNEKVDPVLGLNLFSLKGERWKDMRSTLSPAFTSSKMKSMYVLIQDSAENFADYFFQKGNDTIELEMKEVFSRFTNDVIANCAFGIKCDSLKEETNQFFTMGSVLTAPRGLNVLRGICASLFPMLFEFFRIPSFPTHIVDFFRKIITETIEFREKRNVIRPDMIHLLMEARKGRLKHEIDMPTEADTGFATVEESSVGKSISKMELTDDLITAQALVFFFAGFDTTSTVLSFLSYEMALNPIIQTKLQNEIDEAIKNGKVSYEKILSMKYLDQVISETLRMYPPGYVLTRICAKDYEIKAQKDDERDLILEKGCLISIPVGGIHRDSQYYPEPDRFDPDRFNDENKGSILPCSYMPFGSGPRNCIGSRFALLEAKALVVSLFQRFDVVPVAKTTIPIEFAKTFNISVRNGMWLGFKRRKVGRHL